jgi:hypothetical protein
MAPLSSARSSCCVTGKPLNRRAGGRPAALRIADAMRSRFDLIACRGTVVPNAEMRRQSRHELSADGRPMQPLDHSWCEYYRPVQGHRQARRPSITNRRRLILRAITKNAASSVPARRNIAGSSPREPPWIRPPQVEGFFCSDAKFCSRSRRATFAGLATSASAARLNPIATAKVLTREPRSKLSRWRVGYPSVKLHPRGAEEFGGARSGFDTECL